MKTSIRRTLVTALLLSAALKIDPSSVARAQSYYQTRRSIPHDYSYGAPQRRNIGGINTTQDTYGRGTGWTARRTPRRENINTWGTQRDRLPSGYSTNTHRDRQIAGTLAGKGANAFHFAPPKGLLKPASGNQWRQTPPPTYRSNGHTYRNQTRPTTPTWHPNPSIHGPAWIRY